MWVTMKKGDGSKSDLELLCLPLHERANKSGPENRSDFEPLCVPSIWKANRERGALVIVILSCQIRRVRVAHKLHTKGQDDFDCYNGIKARFGRD